MIDELLKEYDEDDNYNQAEQILRSLAESNDNPDINYQDIDNYIKISKSFKFDAP